MEEFDKPKELKYIILWITLITGTIVIANFFDLNVIVVFLLVIGTVLLVAYYLKDKECKHYKKIAENLEKKIGNGKKKEE